MQSTEPKLENLGSTNVSSQSAALVIGGLEHPNHWQGDHPNLFPFAGDLYGAWLGAQQFCF